MRHLFFGVIMALVLTGCRENAPWDGNAKWVWPAQLGCPTNTMVEFSRQFVTKSDGAAKLAIAADTVYRVQCNGKLIYTGRFPDVPPQRYYDVLTLDNLKAGTNELLIALHVQGVNTFQHIPGDPGLMYTIKGDGFVINSGEGDLWRINTQYKRENVPLVSTQLGFAFEFDATAKPQGWQQVGANDVREFTGELIERPVPRVELMPSLPTKIIAQGPLDGSPAATEVAKGMDATKFGKGEITDCSGFYMTADLGREEAGFLLLDIEANEGTIVDIGHAEHIEAGRIRTNIGVRCFAGRYIAKAGRQRFVHWVHRMAGRYIQIQVRGEYSKFKLHELTVIPTIFPVEENVIPASLDKDEAAIWKTSVRTLRLCMHEHYEDCPWREQALYGNDSRNQMLAGYYAFGPDNRMPELALELLAKGLDEKSWVELCMPAKIGLAIPSFTFSWVMAVGDHLRFRHNLEFTRRMYPYVKQVMDARSSEIKDGLLPCPIGGRYWQFYDWARDLSGSLAKALKGEGTDYISHEAPLNLFAILSFESAAKCADAIGEKEDAARWRNTAEVMRTAVRAKLWNVNKQQLETRLEGGLAPAELTQALGLLTNVIPEESRAMVIRKLCTNSDWTETTLSQSLYKYEALLREGGDAAKFARKSIKEIWKGMLDEGATSFWEVRDGWNAWGAAGSLCHGWSAIPAYFYGAYMQ